MQLTNRTTSSLNFLRKLKRPNAHTRTFSRPMSSPPNEHLFSYTSGRFLFNEKLRQKERYVRFNIEALKQLAAEHIQPSHGKVVNITKLAEGGFNRVFLLTLEDGFHAIAKIPYHIAVPQRYATASEAATLELLRVKGVPVPKVYGYSASADNPAGVEYIIMEKANGVRLDEKWFSLTKRERHKLASSFVGIEKRLFDIPFHAIGSIYFKSDVPSNLQVPLYSEAHESHEQDDTSKRFCIGPIADYMFWYGKRAALDIHRGPCMCTFMIRIEQLDLTALKGNDANHYLRSVAEKEIEWTRRYGKPLELDFPHNGAFPGKHSPDRYLALLEKYLALVPYLLPKVNSDPLNQPTLRHPDLNPNNIFVYPENGAISCIIDWQHATIEPRLLVAGYPRAFENSATDEPLGLEEPKLPHEYDSLSVEDKAEADELYRRQTLFYYYRVFNGVFNKPHLSALLDPLLHPRKHLVDRAGRQWSGNLMTLKGALVRMTEYWSLLPDTKGIQCPVEFKPQELEEFQKQEEIWFCFNAVVNQWRDELGGVNEDGWISNEQYGNAVRKARELKETLILEAEGDEEDIVLLNRRWPFGDQEEVN
ncbi:hypothetical protein PRK78_001691 [Emydomyces testavorans]|uniref:Aminoglycoside phosphotransferase domain-containing protein n=1 Tax=Emydomyces testavorans TaxID=2070801 RepID=A0AAF0DD55_9EURO|nr:hypothetical protein PRK78_001691 [Emydomyces testavorans]